VEVSAGSDIAPSVDGTAVEHARRADRVSA